MKHHPPEGAVQRALRLRRDPTEAEKRMWRLLREGFRESRLRRQVPIRHFIVDLASHRHRIVIEVDGGQHDHAVDAARTAVLTGEGYSILRFWNNEVLGNLDGVQAVITGALHENHPHPNPPPSRGRESLRTAD